MTRMLALIFLASMAFAEDTVIPLGLGDIPAVPSPTAISTILAASTILNASSPTYALATGSYNPATDAIVTPDVRRQRNQVIGANTYAMDLIEGARTNLLATGTSGRFDQWTAAAGATVTADTVASPNGDVNGQTITDPGASLSSVEQTFTVANDSLVHVFSIYVLKTAGGTAPTFGVSLTLSGGTPVTTNARIDTDDGTQEYGSNANTYIETSSAGTWYRVVTKVTNNTSGNTTLTLDVFPAASAHNASVDDAAATGIAKCTLSTLEKAAFASSAISNRNCLLQTQVLNTTWTKTRCTITSDSTANPVDAAVNADTIVEDNTGTNTHFIGQSFTKAAAAIQFTYSTYLKQSGRTWALVQCSDTGITNGAGIYFDVANGVKGTAVALGAGWTLDASHIVAVGSWYRCDITVTTATSTTIRAEVYTSTADLGSIIVTPLNAAALICWGNQLEYGAKANTYWANTTGSGFRIGTVLTTTNTLGQIGTIFAVFRPYGWTTDQDGSTAYKIFSGTTISSIRGASASLAAFNRGDVGGNEGGSFSGLSPVSGANTSTGLTWDSSGVGGYLNGTQGLYDTTLTPPYNAETLMGIGSGSGGGQPIFGQALLLAWPTALTPSSMQVLNNGVAP